MPFGGLAGGEPLVNVLEVNLELEKQRPAAR
jgi:K+-transporting ATPase c subunit